MQLLRNQRQLNCFYHFYCSNFQSFANDYYIHIYMSHMETIIKCNRKMRFLINLKQTGYFVILCSYFDS